MAISSSRDCPKCGSDHKSKPFALYEDGWHCFSCGASKRAIRNFRVNGLENSENVIIPEHTLNPSMFSLPVLKWLRGYHVTDDIIYKHRIAEATDNSVITPVIENEQVVMYQRRWFEPRRIMTYGAKQSFVARCQDTEQGIIVLVEDFISAIRVGEVADGFCMFGTSLVQGALANIIKSYDSIVIWTDGDKPGQTAATKLKNLLNYEINKHLKERSYNCKEKTVFHVITEKDPKAYTKSEITGILQTSGVFNEHTNR